MQFIADLLTREKLILGREWRIDQARRWEKGIHEAYDWAEIHAPEIQPVLRRIYEGLKVERGRP